MVARIYKPAKTAMQSGIARAKHWVLEFEPEKPQEIEPLMGWTSSEDMRSQVHINFNTKEDAVAYAKRNNIEYIIQEPKKRKPTKKSYADNFSYGRLTSWTH